MQFPASTGTVAAYLGCTEPQLNDLIRRGKIQPPPIVASGRRLWLADHVAAAAIALGRNVPAATGLVP